MTTIHNSKPLDPLPPARSLASRGRAPPWAARFGFVFDFPDYSPVELGRIFLKKAGARGFTVGAEASAEAIGKGIADATSEAWRLLRNGGVADVLFRLAAKAQDRRLLPIAIAESLEREAASTIELADVREACTQLERNPAAVAEAAASKAAAPAAAPATPVLPEGSREGRMERFLESELQKMVGMHAIKAKLRQCVAPLAPPTRTPCARVPLTLTPCAHARSHAVA